MEKFQQCLMIVFSSNPGNQNLGSIKIKIQNRTEVGAKQEAESRESVNWPKTDTVDTLCFSRKNHPQYLASLSLPFRPLD